MRKVCDALEDVNLDPALVLHKLPSELSGGMRKRVGLARAIVGRPRILLYDEPVTGLDPVNTAAISRLIQEIRERSHVTSIVVTHDIEQALEISDRVALLTHGRLRFVGTPLEFRASDDPVVRAFADRRAAAAAAAVQLVEEDEEEIEEEP
jgi:phospholipid/cholesterol/gamma-HCH transport system ATP-binding protein